LLAYLLTSDKLVHHLPMVQVCRDHWFCCR